jgi:aminocarboxymuconate-semialdehyde decarboxylase
MFVIDCHAHFVPQTFPPRPEGVAAHEWPEMLPLQDGRARMMIDGREFRIFESAYWDVPGRIAVLDEEGIDLQVLSPLPELLGYWFQPATTAAMAESVNAAIAAAVAAAPSRLAGMGMLPLQDVEASAAMVPALAALGLRGVIVASNINGTSIADPRFYPVFEALQAQNLALFVHGYRPAGLERFIGSPLLGPIAGVPQDTSAAIASFIATDIFAHFPTLRLGFAHGGGGFGAVLARMDHVWHEFPDMQKGNKTAPRDYVKKFYFDTVTFGSDYLAYLITAFGPDTLMAGTDGPTPIGQRGLRKFVETAAKGDDVAAILAGNAKKFFGI